MVARFLFFLSVCAFLGALRPALAQTIPDTVLRQQDQILRDQHERLRQEELERRRDLVAPPSGTEEEDRDVFPLKTDGPCVTISRVVLEGVQATPGMKVSDILSPARGQCLGAQQIDHLLKQLTNRYVAHGLVTTRVYVPPQDLAGGVLRLLVVEGVVEDFEIEEGALSPWALSTAFPGLKGKLLNLRDLEQGLDQINRLRRNTARMDLKPGASQGGSVVVIKNQRQPWWFVTTSVDNAGSLNTGEHQGSVSLQGEDLLGLNDQWTVSQRRSFPLDGSLRDSRTLSGSVSFPLGYWTFTLSGNHMGWHHPIKGFFSTMTSSGTSRSVKAQVDRVMYRDAVSKTLASTSLAVTDTESFLENIRLVTGSRRLTAGTLGMTHSRRIASGALSVTGTLGFGLGLFGAERDKGKGSVEPRARFRKWTGDVSWWQSLPNPIPNTALSWNSTARVQWSRHTLHSAERFSVGGLYSVRGFKGQSLSGDSGLWWRNDLRLTLPSTTLGPIDRALGRAYVSLSYDIGKIKSDPRDQLERGVASGISASLGTSGGPLSLSLTWAQELRSPAFLTAKNNAVYLSASLGF